MSGSCLLEGDYSCWQITDQSVNGVGPNDYALRASRLHVTNKLKQLGKIECTHFVLQIQFTPSTNTCFSAIPDPL